MWVVIRISRRGRFLDLDNYLVCFFFSFRVRTVKLRIRSLMVMMDDRDG